jgi:hypothetical protein
MSDLRDVRGEEEILAPTFVDDLVEAGLVDGQLLGVPLGDALGALVDDRHPDVRALEGDHAAGRTAHVAGPDAADLRYRHLGQWERRRGPGLSCGR